MRSLLLVGLTQLAAVDAWGWQGHGMTGNLAQYNLTQTARKAVESLLPDFTKGQLGNAASWADKVKRRPQYAWTKILHYINPKDTPPSYCGYEKARDCPGTCISTGIMNLTESLNAGWKQVVADLESGRIDASAKVEQEQLLVSAMQQYKQVDQDDSKLKQTRSRLLSSDSEREALDQLTTVQENLMFLVHAIGDIHQPLHATGRDRGGNQAPVTYGSRRMNLHSVWDTRMLLDHKKEYPDYMQHLRDRLANETVAICPSIGSAIAEEGADVFEYARDGERQTVFEFKKTTLRSSPKSAALGSTVCPDSWITESNLINCAHVWRDFQYGMEVGSGTKYFDDNRIIVEQQVVRAGLRIAATLNEIFK